MAEDPRQDATYEWRPEQETAFQAWLAGATVADLAATAKVSRSTIWRWKKSPEWARLAAERRADAATRVTHRTIDLVLAALGNVAAGLEQGDIELSVRVLERVAPALLGSAVTAAPAVPPPPTPFEIETQNIMSEASRRSDRKHAHLMLMLAQ